MQCSRIIGGLTTYKHSNFLESMSQTIWSGRITWMQSAPRLHIVYIFWSYSRGQAPRWTTWCAFTPFVPTNSVSLHTARKIFIYLLTYFTSVVRPILEYACPVWHWSLTVAQANALESMQKRAMGLMCQADYKMACIIVGINDLHSRREHLTLSFFNRNVLNIESGLHYLLPDKRDPDIINRLRKPKQYQSIHSWTAEFRKSYILLVTINDSDISLICILYFNVLYVLCNPAISFADIL